MDAPAERSVAKGRFATVVIQARLARQRNELIQLVQWYLDGFGTKIDGEQQLARLRQVCASVRVAFTREQRFLRAVEYPNRDIRAQNQNHVLESMERLVMATFTSEREREMQMRHAVDELLVLQMMDDTEYRDHRTDALAPVTR